MSEAATGRRAGRRRSPLCMAQPDRRAGRWPTVWLEPGMAQRRRPGGRSEFAGLGELALVRDATLTSTRWARTSGGRSSAIPTGRLAPLPDHVLRRGRGGGRRDRRRLAHPGIDLRQAADPLQGHGTLVHDPDQLPAAEQNAMPVAPPSPCGEPGNTYPIRRRAPARRPKANVVRRLRRQVAPSTISATRVRPSRARRAPR